MLLGGVPVGSITSIGEFAVICDLLPKMLAPKIHQTSTEARLAPGSVQLYSAITIPTSISHYRSNNTFQTKQSQLTVLLNQAFHPKHTTRGLLGVCTKFISFGVDFSFNR